jgi:DNA-binding NtrC family response regulator
LLATSDHNPSFYGVIRDISPQKGAEREFQENQKRMRSSFQMLKDLIDSHSNAFQISNHIESPQSLPKASRLLEMNYIEAALRKTKGRVQPAARLLGISRYTLIRQIAKMGIDTKKFKD